MAALTLKIPRSTGRTSTVPKLALLPAVPNFSASTGQAKTSSALAQLALQAIAGGTQQQQTSSSTRSSGSSPTRSASYSPSAPSVSLGGGVATGNPLVKTALTQLGVRYVWGGTSWGRALDCSGLVQQTYAKNGISIGRTTYTQWAQGKPVTQLQPGDVVFFHMTSKGPSHEGMYIGGGKFIEAPHTGDHVKVATLATYGGYVGARRFS